MCYSMMVKQSVEVYGRVLGVPVSHTDDEEFAVRVFPHGNYPVVGQGESGEREVHEMRYSLIPHWSPVERPKFATYNARIETIANKPTWRTPLAKKHCLVGLTSFFESCYVGSHAGNIVEFQAPEQQELLVVAGIYDQWVNKETGEVVESFAIITKAPSKFIQEVGHDRSPVFLSESAWQDWLKKTPQSLEEAKEFLLSATIDPLLDVRVERPLKEGWEKRK